MRTSEVTEHPKQPEELDFDKSRMNASGRKTIDYFATKDPNKKKTKPKVDAKKEIDIEELLSKAPGDIALPKISTEELMEAVEEEVQ